MFYVNQVSADGFFQHGPFSFESDSCAAAWELARSRAVQIGAMVPRQSDGRLIQLGLGESFAYGVTVKRSAPFRTLAEIELMVFEAEQLAA